jgi:PEP-CTERM motif
MAVATKSIAGNRCDASGLLAAVAVTLLTAVAQPAVAATTKSIEFTGFEYGSVNVKIGAIPATSITQANIGAYNTKIGTDLSGGTNYTYGSTFESFCIDVWQTLSFNRSPDYTLGYTPTAPSPYQTGKDYTYRSSMIGYTPKTGSPGVDPISTQVVQNLSRLYDEAHSGGHLVNSPVFTSSNPNTAFNSPVGSAALQLAIWEIVYDTDKYNTNGGYYYLNSGNNTLDGDFYSVGNTTVNSLEVVAQAQEWLNYLMAYSPSKYGISGYVSQNKQDVIVFTAVPEPGTYALLVAGLGLLGIASRRRKRKAVVA